jgi:hypothetical protein
MSRWKFKGGDMIEAVETSSSFFLPLYFILNELKNLTLTRKCMSIN